MYGAYSAFGFVLMLTAGATGPERFKANFLGG
jgi:hypothetical protein